LSLRLFSLPEQIVFIIGPTLAHGMDSRHGEWQIEPCPLFNQSRRVLMRRNALALSGIVFPMLGLLWGSPALAQMQPGVETTDVNTSTQNNIVQQMNATQSGTPTSNNGTQQSGTPMTQQPTAPSSPTVTPVQSNNNGGELRGLDRANQVAGDHGQQGRDIASSRPDIRQDVWEMRSDARDLNKDLKDVRQDVAKLNTDLTSKADAATIAADRQALAADLKSLARDRHHVNADVRDVRHDVRTGAQDTRHDLTADARDIRHDARDLHQNRPDKSSHGRFHR
jgi:hypothetical protein